MTRGAVRRLRLVPGVGGSVVSPAAVFVARFSRSLRVGRAGILRQPDAAQRGQRPPLTQFKAGPAEPAAE